MSDPFDFSAYAPTRSTSPDPGEGGATTSDDVDVAHAPRIWLVASIAVSAAAVGLALRLSGRGALTIVPWVVAGPGAMTALAVFTLLDTRERARPLYASRSIDGVLYALAVIAIVIAVLVSALQLAFWIGRL